MKKVILLYLLLVVILIVAVALRSGNFDVTTLFQPSKKPSVEINNKRFEVNLAATEESRSIGLSNTDKLDSNKGMLFVFDKKDFHRFWMRNMKFPIDIIYIDDNIIVDIIKNAEPPEDNSDTTNITIYTPEKAANYVLEINTGLSDKNNFNKGDEVKFNNINNVQTK